MTGTFNLIDEPWIVVLDDRGRTRDVSIHDALCDATELVSIGGDISTQQFAITRILLAVIHRAIEWGDDPVDRWGEMWRSGVLPQREIERYLNSVRHRFDLLDSEQPFFQVTDFVGGKDGPKAVGLIVSDVPARHQYFTTRAGAGAADLSLAEAARWIVHTQAFDVSGIKTGDPRDPRTKGGRGYPMGIAWSGQLGGVLLEGTTLTKTLLLNTVLVQRSELAIVPDDLPAWERPHTTVLVRDDPAPTGPVDLLTWQSRRIRVVYKDRRAVGVTVGNGDPIEPRHQLRREHFTGWRYSKNKSHEFGENTFYPRLLDADRVVWRGFKSLLVDIQDEKSPARGFAPALFKWLDHLVDQGQVDVETIVTPHTFGLRYDTQASVIGAAIDDRIDMRVANFGTGDSECRDAAIDAARLAESVARAVGSLASELTVAAGGEGDGEREDAQRRFLSAVDLPYRRWLIRLGVEEPNALVLEWHSALLRIARRIGDELVLDSGRPAFIGREVTNVRGQTYWIDTAAADQHFRSALRRHLTGAFLTSAGSPSE